MILIFNKKVSLNGVASAKLPLAESGRQYKLIDIKINAIDENGKVLKNGFSEVDIILDTTRIVDKVSSGTVSGNIASINLNQSITALTDIEISSTSLSGITPITPIKYIDISFFVSDTPNKKG